MRWSAGVRVVATVAALGAVIALVALLFPKDGGSNTGPPRMVRFATLGPVPSDAHYVSPQGSDRSPGTVTNPWKTLQKAMRVAKPGDTVVLDPGTYGERGHVNLFNHNGTQRHPIVFRGAPYLRSPRILGFVKITASNVRLADLVFAGPTGRVQPQTQDNPRGEQVQVAVYGPNKTVRGVWIYHCVVRNAHWHAGIFLSYVKDVRIVGNYIHDNGDPNDPGQANMSHGIYWSSGSGLIANNVVEHNVARGVQLYPAPSGVVITQNTIVHNGAAGVQLGGQASNNEVINNIVAFNGNEGIRPASLSGIDNTARDNLLWANGFNNEKSAGFLLSNNIVAKPMFSTGYELQRNSPAVNRAENEWTVPIDRAGVHRPRGKAADLGAFESW